MIVAKIGGALLSDADGIARACALVRSLPAPLLVVVSAMRGVTRELEALARAAAAGHADAEKRMEEIINCHDHAATALLPAGSMQAWRESTEPERQRLDEVVRGLGIVRELSARTLDLVEHIGERLASALFTAALDAAGGEAERVSALDLIITDATHRFARPDPALTRERALETLGPLLTGTGVVITEGYIARASDGSVTTMGRESSDYSATLLGSLLDAEEVRIYTTVEGVMTADPTVVPEARTIGRISYAMANALAESGAQILHPRTVLPVRKARIPLSIRPLAGGGTTIAVDGDSDAWSVALNRNAELVAIETSTAGARLDNFLHVVSGRAPIAWHHRFRRRSHLVLAQRFNEPEIPLDALAEPSLLLDRRPVALVSIVSQHAPSTGLLGRALLLLEHEGIGVRAVQDAIDTHAVSVAVEPQEGERAVQLLHDAMPALGGTG